MSLAVKEQRGKEGEGQGSTCQHKLQTWPCHKDWPVNPRKTSVGLKMKAKIKKSIQIFGPLLFYVGNHFETPTPHTRQKYEQQHGRKTVNFALFLGSYFVQIFVHIFALYVGGGGHLRISDYDSTLPAAISKVERSIHWTLLTEPSL